MEFGRNIDEARRCLLCRKPRCSAACPVDTDVPACMRLYREGKYAEAGKILFDNNPLSAITSQVCDWHRRCFGHCVLNAKGVPVHWYQIEQELSLEYLKTARIVPGSEAPLSGSGTAEVNSGKHIAIVGGGPAGMTAAFYLRQLGYEVTIFDREPDLGGVLRHGIPPFRLDKAVIDRYEEIVIDAGIGFRGDISVGGRGALHGSDLDNAVSGTCVNVDIERLFADYDALLLATGAIIPRPLDIPGEKDNPHVLYALDYLEDPSLFHLGPDVVVIGGGNVTMDASRTALHNGLKPTVYYRKSFENMPANTEEITAAREEGVKFELFQVPVEIRGQVAIMRRCENVVAQDGTIYTHTVPGTEHEVPFDDMIVAVSANVDDSVFGALKPSLDSKGRPVVDEYYRIPLEGRDDLYLFAAGDFVTGPMTVVDAVASARMAASGMHAFLSGR